MPCDPERAPSLYHWGALWGQREELSTGRPPARIGAAMQIEFLETFVEVARHGSLTRAAEQLYLSQPSVSGRLQAIEAELGEPLLVRTPRGVRLTDAGREFLPYAERVVRAFRDGQAALSDLRSAQARRLLLGAAPAVGTYFLPTPLNRFATEHPG